MAYTYPQPNAVNFEFDGYAYQNPPANGVDFSFAPEAGEVVSVEVVGTMPGLSGLVQLIPIAVIESVGSFPQLVLSAEANYSSNTARPTIGKTDSAWQVAGKIDSGKGTRFQDSTSNPHGWGTRFQDAAKASQGIEHKLPEAFVKGWLENAARHQDAVRAHDETFLAHQEASRAIRQNLVGRHQDAVRAHDDTGFRHQDGDRTKRGSISAAYEEAVRLHAYRYSQAIRNGRAITKQYLGRHQDGIPPPAGLTVITPPTNPDICYTPSGDLVYSKLWSGDTNLVFICDNYVEPPPPFETVVVPVRRVYIVINSATLVRVSNGAVIPTLGMSMSLDVDSWTWSFNARVPGQALDLVQQNSNGDPVELQATINGADFRLIAERISRSRAFGKSDISVSGRGHAAFLDSPYSPILSFDNSAQARTAQQLMGDVLTLNGVPIGWGVNWELTDWLVNAGNWSHQGSYMSGLTRIAESAGAYIQPHRTLQQVYVKHRYPTAPWNWASVTPDYELPSAVTTTEGIEWLEKPDYNAVYVSGQQNGVLGYVKRQGSAGDNFAQMITDPLITHADAARQRGTAILGDTGRQALVSLRLPVLQETGIIDPGKFVRYVDGSDTKLGIVRSVQVEVGMPNVFQTIGVETHV